MLLALLLQTADAASVPSLYPPKTGLHTDADAAVVIGNAEYQYLPSVPYAVEDADLFETWLRNTHGIPSDRLAVLRDANHSNMRRAIEDAAKLVLPGGTLWIYYAGHGIGVARGDGTTSRALVGKSAEADDSLPDFTLTLDAIQSIAAGSRASNVVILLDACYNNAGRSGEPLVEGRAVMPTSALKPLQRITLWTATDSGEYAKAYEPAQHGLFTYLSIGAMSGWGDINGDGVVTTTEADDWVTRATRAVSDAHQTPQMAGPQGVTLATKVQLARMDLDALPRTDAEKERARITSRARGHWAAAKALDEAGDPAALSAVEKFVSVYGVESFEIADMKDAQKALKRLRLPSNRRHAAVETAPAATPLPPPEQSSEDLVRGSAAPNDALDLSRVPAAHQSRAFPVAVGTASCSRGAVPVSDIMRAARAAEAAALAGVRESFSEERAALMAELVCVVDLMQPAEVAEIHRVEALWAFANGDPGAATLAFQAALSLASAPDYMGGTDFFPTRHPLRKIFERALTAGMPDRSPLGLGEDTLTYVDGSRSDQRPAGLPFLLQVSQGASPELVTVFVHPGDTLLDP